MERNVTFSDWSGIEFSWRVSKTIYPPREDTHLLSDSLANLLSGSTGKRILEVGCGSGAISLVLCSAGHEVTSVDIHPEAAAITCGLLQKYHFQNATVVEGDIRDVHLDGNYDFVIWNTPYLNRPYGEMAELTWADEISLSACPGDHEVLLTRLERGLLSREGLLILVLSDNDESKDVLNVYLKKGWAANSLAQKSFSSEERLFVVCLWKPWSKGIVQRISSTQSTNDLALNEELSEEGSVFFTGDQQEGRGRFGNQWDSHRGDFAGSWILPTWSFEKGLEHLHFQCGLAVIDAMLRLNSNIPTSIDWASGWHPDFGLKWPNDIHYRGKKVGGILIESASKGKEIDRIIVGIGLNLTPRSDGFSSLPSELGGIDELFAQLHPSIASRFENKFLFYNRLNRDLAAYHRSLWFWSSSGNPLNTIKFFNQHNSN